jgi:hypothetical protein
MTTIRTAFGSALSLRHIQRPRLRQRPNQRKGVLQSRRIGVLGGGILIVRGDDIGMLGALTFFLRQLHEWRATPARGSLAFRRGSPPLSERVEDSVDHCSQRLRRAALAPGAHTEPVRRRRHFAASLRAVAKNGSVPDRGIA